MFDELLFFFHPSKIGISYKGTKCAPHTLANIHYLSSGAHFAAPSTVACDIIPLVRVRILHGVLFAL